MVYFHQYRCAYIQSHAVFLLIMIHVQSRWITWLFVEVRQKFSSQKFCRNCRRLFRWIDIWTKACELIELKMNWSFSGFSTEMNRFIWKYQLARCGISFLFLQSKHPCLQPVKKIQLVSSEKNINNLSNLAH